MRKVLLVLMPLAVGAGVWWFTRAAHDGSSSGSGSAGSPSSSGVAPVPTGAVEGIVRRRDEDAAFPGAPVRVTRQQGEAWSEIASAVTDAGGWFRLEGLPTGAYRVMSGGGNEPLNERTQADVRVEAGGTAKVALELEEMPADGTVYCRGTIAYDGGRRPKKFSFRFWAVEGGGARRYAVEAEDDWFGKRLPKPGTYLVTALTVDGEPHDYFFREVKVKEGEPLSLIVEEEREVGVFVMDPETRQPVGGARVYRLDSRDRKLLPDLHAPPPAAILRLEPLRTDGTGRVSFGRGRGPEVIWVHADGYAWSRGAVSRGAGEDGRIELSPGGSLRVRVPGWAGLKDARIGAWKMPEGSTEHDDLGLPMEVPLPAHGEEEVLAEGFVPGRYLLRAWSGAWPRHDGLHGKAVVTVLAREESPATVE